MPAAAARLPRHRSHLRSRPFHRQQKYKGRVWRLTLSYKSQAFFRRSQAYAELHEFEFARRDLLKAQELDPKSGEIKATLVKLKTKQQQYQRERAERERLEEAAASALESTERAQQQHLAAAEK